jgi:hypothetical protein
MEPASPNGTAAARRRAAGWPRAVLAGCAALAVPASAQHFPPIQPAASPVRLTRVADDLAGEVGGAPQVAPSDVVPFPDGSGRLAVATLGGVVRVVDGGGALLPTPLLSHAQTQSDLPASGEWGMTAIAFDPDFGVPASPGYGTFYTITTRSGNDGGVVPDFGSTGLQDHQDLLVAWTLADPARSVWGEPGDTQRELLRVGQPGEAHNLVDLAFGPDHMLYASSGDGGLDGAASQDPRTVFGTILRIDPHGSNGRTGEYGIPPDNPYAGGQLVTLYSAANPAGEPVDPLDEVFAYGFRSPYRIGFDRLTGDLYVGEVGQSDVEEVDRVEAGGNYGWNAKEGSLKSGQNLGCCRVEPDTPANNPFGDTTLAEQFGLVDPLLEYDHDEGLVVVGGFVYRGSQLPALQGRYVFADLGESNPSARLFAGDLATGEIRELPVDPGGAVFANGLALPHRILAIGEDADGELLLAVVGADPREGGGSDGALVALPEPGGPSLLAAGAAALLATRRARRTAPTPSG